MVWKKKSFYKEIIRLKGENKLLKFKKSVPTFTLIYHILLK